MTCNKCGVQPMKPGQILTIKVPVYPATDEARELAGNGLRLWRGVCTKASAALAAVELATGVLEVDKEGNLFLAPEHWEKNGPLFQALWGHEKSDLALDRFIKRECPSWTAATYQLARREVVKRWGAKDADKTALSRRFLTHQSERRPAVFVNAPLQILYCESSSRAVRIDIAERTIALHWDSDAGYVPFKLLELDPLRWRVLKGLADGSIMPGGCKLQMIWGDKGPRFEIRFGYYAPVAERMADPKRVMEVAFSEDREAFMVHSLRSGHRPATGLPVDSVRGFAVSAVACLAQLDRIRAQSEGIESELKAVGRVRHVRRGVVSRSERLTRRRDAVVRDWCHVWSKMAIQSAARMDCGRIEVIGMPAQLFGRPWQWSTFKFDLEYKAKLAGLAVAFSAGAVAESVPA